MLSKVPNGAVNILFAFDSKGRWTYERSHFIAWYTVVVFPDLYSETFVKSTRQRYPNF